MHRSLVLALVVCALGVGLAVALSLTRVAKRPSAADPASVTVASTDSTGPDVTLATSSDSSAPPSATPSARSWPDGSRGEFVIQVVRDEGGTPIAGARVWGEKGTPSEELGSRTTDSNGLVRWTDLPQCALAFEATAPGFTTANARVAFDPQLTMTPFVVRLPSQREVRVRLVDAQGMDATTGSLGIPSQGSASLTIGLAAACTAVGEQFDSRGAPTYRVLSDSWSGDVLAWRLQIRGSDPACAHLLLGDLVLAAEPLDPRSTELAIAVSREDMHRGFAPILVRVLAEGTRDPIPGAEIALLLSQNTNPHATSDGDGRARFENFFAGEFQLLVTAPGFAYQMIPVRRPIAGEIEVLLRIGHEIDGTVVDPSGAPKANVHLVAYDATQLGGSARALGNTTTDAVGRFHFEELAAEEVVLVTSLTDVGDGAVSLPPRASLTSAYHIVPCQGGARDVVIRWVPLDPEKYARSRAGAAKN